MSLESYKTYSKGDSDFEEVLDLLQTKYFHNGGDEEAEVVINWKKPLCVCMQQILLYPMQSNAVEKELERYRLCLLEQTYILTKNM